MTVTVISLPNWSWMSTTDIIGYNRAMGRWKPDARGRLVQAALELYSERGFEQTTVAEIAKRAGLSERTFFRHFTDKREVLFAGADELEEPLVRAVEEASSSLPPLEVVGKALEAVAAHLPERPDFPRRRQAIIDANPELQERERVKLASLAVSLADALRQRGVADPTAVLAAEMGIAVFRVAFERWISETNQQHLPRVIRDSLDELKAITAGKTMV
jgi:AcrR family transcriptional regulator